MKQCGTKSLLSINIYDTEKFKLQKCRLNYFHTICNVSCETNL